MCEHEETNEHKPGKPSIASDARKAQEAIKVVLDGGYMKPLVELQAKLMEMYVGQGFTREEAMEFIKLFTAPKGGGG